MGEIDVSTLGTELGQVLVTQQPTLGSLFKSQNASVWTPSQYEDLKFNFTDVILSLVVQYHLSILS